MILKRASISALKRHRNISQSVHAKLDAYMKNLKRDGFLLFRYSVQKQILLRERLTTEFVQNRRKYMA